jgi:hypothetical protein
MSRRWVLRHTPRRVVLVGPVVACCAGGWLCARLGARCSTLVVGSVAVLAAFFGGYGWQVLWRAYCLRCWLDPGGDSPPAHSVNALAGGRGHCVRAVRISLPSWATASASVPLACP